MSASALRTYLSVVKPGIVMGNLVSAAGGFLLAARGRIDLAVLVPSIAGIALVIASACVFNNAIDRDIDAKMARTRGRVLVRGAMSQEAALMYASLLGLSGAAMLWAAAGPLALAVVLGGFVIYVGLYTMCLKRNSPHGALVGSFAGAAPPVAGYCAASGNFDAGALILLAIFCLWQMPHWYAIAIFRESDYAAAEIPALPPSGGVKALRKQIVAYILAFIAAAMTLTLAGYTGAPTMAVTGALGGAWLLAALKGCGEEDERRWARRVFALSIVNILALSVMMAIDFRP